ncbi:hypothetical protein [Candidatus Neptunochlamydia vexilliferae]|uniref:Uncharacterized protein n=1 Tax=Candidatus Neptunichlamydia vexilliferae TaxID=1651774 RepID=A0ABS0B021_9BACT|nr:hypothetical protein [Candidatus Neptunochlamydia vexilliferae]MBF5059733.1 hypothetical protein [Candidatus Neptunochlamydia vexilliferae]
MPIYDIYEHVEKQKREGGPKIELSTHISEATLRGRHRQEEEKGHLFATIAARLFFFILLVTDLFWGAYTIALFFSSLALNLLSGFKIYKLKTFFARRYLNLKRAAICAIALLVSLFSPALGTMIACSYFLMYDKKGIKEVVPSVLQEQFEEFMNPQSK